MRAPSLTRRTLLHVVAIGLVAAAIAAAMIVAFREPEAAEVEESRFPPYWAQIEEGETTRRELLERLGEPERVEDDCLLYDRLVAAQNYKFCFTRDDVLFQKAAY